MQEECIVHTTVRGEQTIIKVPKEKLATYRKLFRSKGLSSKVKIIGY